MQPDKVHQEHQRLYQAHLSKTECDSRWVAASTVRWTCCSDQNGMHHWDAEGRPHSEILVASRCLITRIESKLSRRLAVEMCACTHDGLSAKLARMQKEVQREACLQQHADWVAPTDGVAVLLQVPREFLRASLQHDPALTSA